MLVSGGGAKSDGKKSYDAESSTVLIIFQGKSLNRGCGTVIFMHKFKPIFEDILSDWL